MLAGSAGDPGRLLCPWEAALGPMVARARSATTGAPTGLCGAPPHMQQRQVTGAACGATVAAERRGLEDGVGGLCGA